MTKLEIIEYQKPVKGFLSLIMLSNMVKLRQDLIRNMHQSLSMNLSHGVAGPWHSILIWVQSLRLFLMSPYPNIDDINSLAIPILRHRVLTNFNAETYK